MAITLKLQVILTRLTKDINNLIELDKYNLVGA